MKFATTPGPSLDARPNAGTAAQGRRPVTPTPFGQRVSVWKGALRRGRWAASSRTPLHHAGCMAAIGVRV
eukprot:9764015-Alexandrium_andersonii.AAC.1